MRGPNGPRTRTAGVVAEAHRRRAGPSSRRAPWIRTTRTVIVAHAMHGCVLNLRVHSPGNGVRRARLADHVHQYAARSSGQSCMASNPARSVTSEPSRAVENDEDFQLAVEIPERDEISRAAEAFRRRGPGAVVAVQIVMAIMTGAPDELQVGAVLDRVGEVRACRRERAIVATAVRQGSRVRIRTERSARSSAGASRPCRRLPIVSQPRESPAGPGTAGPDTESIRPRRRPTRPAAS